MGHGRRDITPHSRLIHTTCTWRASWRRTISTALGSTWRVDAFPLNSIRLHGGLRTSPDRVVRTSVMLGNPARHVPGHHGSCWLRVQQAFWCTVVVVGLHAAVAAAAACDASTAGQGYVLVQGSCVWPGLEKLDGSPFSISGPAGLDLNSDSAASLPVITAGASSTGSSGSPTAGACCPRAWPTSRSCSTRHDPPFRTPMCIMMTLYVPLASPYCLASRWHTPQPLPSACKSGGAHRMPTARSLQ